MDRFLNLVDANSARYGRVRKSNADLASAIAPALQGLSDEALQRLERLHETGISEAAVLLGFLWEVNANGPDLVRAEHWYQLALYRHNDPIARFELGRLNLKLGTMDGGPIDEERCKQGEQLLLAQVEAGDSESAILLAHYYLWRRNDEGSGRDWYVDARRQLDWLAHAGFAFPHILLCRMALIKVNLPVAVVHWVRFLLEALRLVRADSKDYRLALVVDQVNPPPEVLDIAMGTCAPSRDASAEG